MAEGSHEVVGAGGIVQHKNQRGNAMIGCQHRQDAFYLVAPHRNQRDIVLIVRAEPLGRVT